MARDTHTNNWQLGTAAAHLNAYSSNIGHLHRASIQTTGSVAIWVFFLTNLYKRSIFLRAYNLTNESVPPEVPYINTLHSIMLMIDDLIKCIWC